jgi:hypothetical protein
VALRDTQHVIDLETRCTRERVQPNDRRVDGPAPADVEGGSLGCGDGAPGYGLRLAIHQRIAPRQDAVGRVGVGVNQLNRNAIRIPLGAM